MSRLTGNDARSLMEAYAAVYAPQITEEQVWEEVEEWVNSLVEEGYDLSEYSWEEMYDAYIEEQGGSRSSLGPIRPEVQARWNAIGNTLAYGNPEGRRSSTQTPAQRNQARMRPGRSSSPATSKPSNQPYQSPFAGKRDEAFAKARQIQGSPVVGPRAASAAAAGGAAASAAGARPAAAAPAGARPAAAAPAGARPAAAAPAGARPAAGAPTGKPAPAASTPARASSPTKPTSTPTLPAAERRTPTSAELRAAQGARAAALASGQTKPEAEKAAVQAGIDRGTKLMGGPEGPGKIDTASVQRDLAKANAPKSTPTPAATPAASSSTSNATTRAFQPGLDLRKPTPTSSTPSKPIPAATGSKKPGSIVSHYDPFDVVIGHLLDEGYADSEESALAIMANMSEEWKNSIIQK